MTTPETWCVPEPPPEDPDWGRGNVVPPTASALCSLGFRPIMITGMLKDHLSMKFSTPASIEDPLLKQILWRDDETTGILIESVNRKRGSLTEKLPAVLLKLNSRRNLRKVIGNLAGVDNNGNPKYQTWWLGSHTAFCVHASGTGADILGTEIEREITQFAPVLTEYLGLYELRVTEVGAAAKVKGTAETFVAPVTVGWVYIDKWKVEREAPKLRRIALSVLLDDGSLLDQ
jgi:hypothetical protein